MSATAIRQAPGWWANLCRAVCDTCGWTGPTRDCNNTHENTLLRLDKSEHRCGEEAGQ